MPKIREIADIFRGQQLTKYERLRINANEENISEAVVVNYDDVLSYTEQLTLENTFEIDYYNNVEKIYVDLKRKFKNTLIKSNDLIFPVKLKIHQIKLMSFSNYNLKGNFIYSNDLLIVRPDENKVNAKFLFYILNTKYIREKLDVEALNYKPHRITCEMVGNLEIQLPTMEEQEKIVNKLQKINYEKMQLEKDFNNFINK